MSASWLKISRLRFREQSGHRKFKPPCLLMAEGDIKWGLEQAQSPRRHCRHDDVRPLLSARLRVARSGESLVRNDLLQLRDTCCHGVGKATLDVAADIRIATD